MCLLVDRQTGQINMGEDRISKPKPDQKKILGMWYKKIKEKEKGRKE